MGKFCAYEHLRLIARRYNDEGKRTVVVGGHFDLLHVGHVAFLAESRRLGDVLMVYVPDDRSSRNIKGPGRPIVPAYERAHVIAALSSTDYATIVPYEMTRTNIVSIDQRLIVELEPAIYVCTENTASRARIETLRKSSPRTEIVSIPQQSSVWSSTRIARALDDSGTVRLDDLQDCEISTERTTDTRHEFFMNAAREAATRSKCPVLRVGAALVKNESVVATGHNEPPSTLRCWCLRDDIPQGVVLPPCTSVHAEASVILDALAFGATCHGATLYVTHAPCFHCAKLVMRVGIRTVVYEDEYATRAGKTLLQSGEVHVSRYVPCVGGENADPDT